MRPTAHTQGRRQHHHRMTGQTLVVDLAATSKNWALTPDGERRLREETPPGWRCTSCAPPTSSDGDGPPRPSDEVMRAIRDAEVYYGFGIPQAAVCRSEATALGPFRGRGRRHRALSRDGRRATSCSPTRRAFTPFRSPSMSSPACCIFCAGWTSRSTSSGAPSGTRRRSFASIRFCARWTRCAR